MQALVSILQFFSVVVVVDDADERQKHTTRIVDKTSALAAPASSIQNFLSYFHSFGCFDRARGSSVVILHF